MAVLDDVGSALMAYSTRKLRDAYAGSAIRVRRDSDDTEQDIGFNGSNELDTSSLLSFVGAGDGLVVTWYDQSGNGFNATQATLARQYRIVNTGSVVVDDDLGLASLEDNTGEFADGAYTVTGDPSPSASNYTVIACFKHAELTNFQYFIDASESAADRWISVSQFNTGTAGFWDGGSFKSVATQTTDHQVMTWKHESPTATLYREGSSLGTGSYTQRSLQDGIGIGILGDREGDGGNIHGYCRELIIYGSALSDANRGTVEAWMNNTTPSTGGYTPRKFGRGFLRGVHRGVA